MKNIYDFLVNQELSDGVESQNKEIKAKLSPITSKAFIDVYKKEYKKASERQASSSVLAKQSKRTSAVNIK